MSVSWHTKLRLSHRTEGMEGGNKHHKNVCGDIVLCLCGLIMYNIYVKCGTQHSIVGEKGYSGIDLVTDL